MVKVNNSDESSNLTLTLLITTLFNKLPLPFIQKFLSHSMFSMLKKHPKIFDKISKDNYSFIIYPYDLPFKFYMEPTNNPKLIAIHKKEDIISSATIKGSLVNLLKMLEGKLDGDAAFFSKEIIIEGSTQASVALRNAIDSEDVNIINDLTSSISNDVFRNHVNNKLNIAIKNYVNIQDKINMLNNAINYDLKKEQQVDRLKLNDIFVELDDIQDTLKRLYKDQTRRKSDYTNNNIINN
jgi:predicted lipid carrier protein YhbT